MSISNLIYEWVYYKCEYQNDTKCVYQYDKSNKTGFEFFFSLKLAIKIHVILWGILI